MGPDYLRRFQEMVADLRKSPDVAVARVHVAPPVTDEAIARVHAKLGFRLSDAIVGFYRQANGLALEWVPKDHPAYDAAAHDEESSEPFDMVPQDVPGGVINIYPFESLLDSYEDVFWFEWMAGQKAELAGQTYDLLAFSKAIRPFDYYSEYTMAAFFLGDGSPDPRVLLGDDHGASFTAFAPTDFSTYMEAILALRGSWVGRERFFCRNERPLPSGHQAWREVAPPLDTLIRWSLEKEPGFAEGSEDDDFDASGLDEDEDFDTSGGFDEDEDLEEDEPLED